MTLIAAIIPPHVVTTHTIFCMRAPAPPNDEELHWFMCGVFNSFVANYLVRLRGGTHVTAATMELLRVPRPPRIDPAVRAIAALARRLSRQQNDTRAYVDLQVRTALLYALSREEFDHVLATFPLIEADIRDACSTAFGSACEAR